MTVQKLITPSETKTGQILDLVRHALRNGGIDDEGAQLIIEQGGLLQQRLTPIFLELATPRGNSYTDEKTRLAYYYPKGWKAANLEEQRERLLAAFPGLKLPDPVFNGQITNGFDGVGYHVFPERLGLHHDINDGNGDNYGQVIEEVVLPALERVYEASGRSLYNYRAGELGVNYIRLDARGRAILDQMQEASKFDAFIDPVSLGQLWKPQTLSPRNARETCFLSKRMLPQGSVQIGCHLVAMPDRLTDYEHLFIDCPGDEYNWDAGGAWARCPLFRFFVGELKFSARSADDADGDYGSGVASLGV